MITISDLYQQARKKLMETEDPQSAGMIARNLLVQATGKRMEQLLADQQAPADASVCAAMEALVSRIAGGEPLAYVLGNWEFYGLPLYVDRNVLIPRDDTCAVTSLAVKQGLFLGENPRILDLCTGSGCIGLALASRLPDARVTLADISKPALAVAHKNIVNNKLSSRVSAVQVNALEAPPPFLGKFDMIVSNPPYITGREMEELPGSVKDFEPHLALYGGEDGLDFYRAIAQNFHSALKPDGYLCFEFGMGQGDEVSKILMKNGYTVLERTKDYNDRERAIIARYTRKED